MKLFIKILILSLLPFFAKAQSQQRTLDSLHVLLKTASNQAVRMDILNKLILVLSESDRDSAAALIEQGLQLSAKKHQPLWRANLLQAKAYINQEVNLPLALKLTNEGLMLAQDESTEKNVLIAPSDKFAGDPHKYRLNVVATLYNVLGNEYSGTNLEKANNYYQKQIDISKEIGADERMVEGSMNKGNILLLQHKLDSAKTYLFNALLSANKSGYLLYKGYILRKIGDLYLQHLQVDSAKYYYRYAIESNTKEYNLTELGRANIVFAKLYNGLQQPDSIMHYARTAFNIAIDLNDPYILASSAGLMSDAYNMLGHTDSAFAYQRISKKLSDSLNTAKIEKITQFQNMGFEEQQRLEKEAQQNKDAKTMITTIALFSGLALVALLAIIFYRNNRQKQKANTVLEKTLSNLKSTQTQLVQSEKMASLGELTAGIAHEIQNPLNFVNNFSEVSNELIDEMNLELDKGDINEAKIISKDIKQNLEKINHHGKRADAIVKGMLQHSQSSSGKKEPTDINALCDEYLRLSYHGLRAKDKSFNATIKTDFDESLSADEAGIGKINIIPQDIGRVILNLINNAFYACAERSRSAVAEKQKQNNPGYEPTVTVSTRLVISPSPIGSGQAGGQRGVEIKVSDNGNGIPQKVLDKIFQPFFTTKPTGQGTGLGLSLAYDIIKANGGEIKVETLSAEAIAQAGTEKVGSAFIIHLPIV